MSRKPKSITPERRRHIEEAALHLLREARRPVFTSAMNRADYAQAWGIFQGLALSGLISWDESQEWRRRLEQKVEAEPVPEESPPRCSAGDVSTPLGAAEECIRRLMDMPRPRGKEVGLRGSASFRRGALSGIAAAEDAVWELCRELRGKRPTPAPPAAEGAP